MLFLNGALGNQLGHCQRQAAGSQGQRDAVDTVSDGIDSVTCVSQQIGHGDPVQNADEPDQNTRHGQDASLAKEVVFSLC